MITQLTPSSSAVSFGIQQEGECTHCDSKAHAQRKAQSEVMQPNANHHSYDNSKEHSEGDKKWQFFVFV
jgi:hypothetical protein